MHHNGQGTTKEKHRFGGRLGRGQGHEKASKTARALALREEARLRPRSRGLAVS